MNSATFIFPLSPSDCVYVSTGVEEEEEGEGEGEGGEGKVPDLKVQKEEIKALLHQKLQKGDTWYEYHVTIM